MRSVILPGLLQSGPVGRVNRTDWTVFRAV